MDIWSKISLVMFWFLWIAGSFITLHVLVKGSFYESTNSTQGIAFLWIGWLGIKQYDIMSRIERLERK